MSTIRIKNHSFERHHRAITNLGEAIRQLDTDLRALSRREGMYPAEKAQKEVEIRKAGLANIVAARQELAEAVADDRETSHYTPEGPQTAEEVARRQYYATQAANELAGLEPRTAMALVESVVAAGDDERSREYVSASRGALFNHDAGAWKKLELAVEPRDAKLHRSFAASVGQVEANMPWVDAHLDGLLKKAGRISDAEKAGREDPEPFSARILTQWLDRVKTEAAVAFERTAAKQDGKAPAEWAAEGAVNMGIADAAPRAGVLTADAHQPALPG